MRVPSPTASAKRFDSSSLGLQCFYGCLQKAVSDRAWVFHGVGVVRAGRGYMMLARSGGGKSTLAALSEAGSATVLGDDAILVLEKDGEFHLRPMPRQSGSPTSVAQLGDNTRLQRVFFLQKAQRSPRAVALTGVEAAARCLSDHVLFGFSEMTAEQRVLVLDRLLHLFRSVPAYVLHFCKDDSFWQVIEQLEACDGSGGPVRPAMEPRSP